MGEAGERQTDWWSHIEVWVDRPGCEELMDLISDVVFPWGEVNKVDPFVSATLRAPTPEWAADEPSLEPKREGPADTAARAGAAIAALRLFDMTADQQSVLAAAAEVVGRLSDA